MELVHWKEVHVMHSTSFTLSTKQISEMCPKQGYHVTRWALRIDLVEQQWQETTTGLNMYGLDKNILGRGNTKQTMEQRRLYSQMQPPWGARTKPFKFSVKVSY